MSEMKIAYISDINYGEYMNKKRLTKMITELNNAGPDVVIFGGDMFYYSNASIPDSNAVREVKELLTSIKAPYGKFSVLGESDLANDDTKKIVSSILYDSNFETITNSTVRIRKESDSSITLIGLDSLIGGNIDAENAFKKVSSDEYNILITHYPDTILHKDVSTKHVDAMFAGHSLGGQIYLPLIGPLNSEQGAKTYPHGAYTVNNTSLFVSNGLGTRDVDMRVFCPPQILVFRLISTQS